MVKITPEIAELAGLFAADGCLQKEYLCFWGNIKEDREYYNQIIGPMFERTFDTSVNVHEKVSNSVYGFYACKKRIVTFFNQVLGFPIETKTHTVCVPRIILNSEDPAIWCSFIRGFFDGDGCLNFDKRYGKHQKILTVVHTYPRISLTSVSTQLIDDVAHLLRKLGIQYAVSTGAAQKENESDYKRIHIKGKKRLEEWMNIIGMNNPAQRTKYEIFKKYGFVPVNTSLFQRREMLQGALDPFEFYPSWARSLAWIGHQV